MRDTMEVFLTMKLLAIDHVGLNVRSLQNSFEFYQKVFEFTIFHKWNTTWMIENGAIKLGLFERPEAAPICNLDQKIAISHLAFRTDTEGFETAQKTLRALGVPYTPPEYTGVAYAIFLLDPDGHQVEITAFGPQSAGAI
jgi:catechol 2,3-dioxygenase-like lactoylglutathione lyase family enzyme